MLNVTSMSAGAAVSYHVHMEKDGQKEDYYAQEGAGKWHGEGAKNLGLNGAVDGSDFKALAHGYDPKTGEALTQNSGEKERVAGYDLTFSAPKSVSIAMAVADPKDAALIQAAHDKAVATALQFVQDKQAQTRTGHGGLTTEKTALTIAVFNHQTSREQDAQIHSHSFVMNIAQRENGTFGALDGKPLYDYKMATGAIYRAELAHEMQKLGYKIERDGESFRLQGVSKESDREFSTRRQQIEKELDRVGQSGAKASEIAALATRKPKEIKDQNELKTMWKDQANALGVREQDLKTDLHKTPDSQLIMPTNSSVLDAITDNKSLVKEQDIYRTAAIESIGNLTAKEAISLAESVKKNAIAMQKEGVNGKNYGEIKYTNQATINREKHIVAMAKVECSNALKPESIQNALTDNPFKLSNEQAKAALELTQNGTVKVLIGDAGTGKSTTLEVVKNAYQNEGWQVIGAAPTGKAAAGLQEGAGIQSSTLHKLERQLDQGAITLNNKTVVIIDEAGMVGSKKMEKLLEKAEAAGAKVILVGDHKQLQSVESGAAFRDISAQVGVSRLETIHRQKDAGDRAAVQQMSKGEATKAMAHYIEKGQVSIEKTYNKAVEEVAKKTIQNLDKGGSSIALASTNKQVKDINDSVRTKLKARGELSNSQKISTEKGKLDLATNDRILLTKNDEKLDVKNGDLATVTKIEKDQFTVKVDRTGEEKTINTSEYKYIEHGYAISTHKAQGMTTDNTVVLAGKDTSRELSYVQASRARDETTFVFTKNTVNKMVEQTKPTPEMSKLAEKIEERRLDRGEKPSLLENHKEDFKATRAYLNEHAYKQEERATDKNREALNELKDTLKAMSTSKANESTQDYKIVEKPLEKDAEKVAAPTIDYKNGDFVQDPKTLPEPVTQSEKDFKTALEKEVSAMDKTNERVEKAPEKDAQKEAATQLTKSHGSPEKAVEQAQKIEERRTARGEEPSLPKEPAKDLAATKQYLDKNEHKFDKAKAVVAAKEARANAGKTKDTDKSKTAYKTNEQPKVKEKEVEYQREMKH